MVGSGSEQPNAVVLAMLIPRRQWLAALWQTHLLLLVLLDDVYRVSTEFLLIFIWLFLCDGLSFAVMLTTHFFMYFPVKQMQRMQRMLPLTCIAGLLCMLDASVSHNTSVCVKFFHSCVTAQLLSILTLMCQLTRIKKLSSTPPAFLTLGW